MKEIKLTQGKISLVDDEDFKRINKFKWYANWDGRNWYARRRKGTKIVMMHRELLTPPIDVLVDHINGNSLDNRLDNLRLCTTQQNSFNQKYPQKNNNFGIKGVYWNKKNKKFKARIQVDGKSIYLGLFNVAGDADSAYRIVEEKYFGEFARSYNKI